MKTKIILLVLAIIIVVWGVWFADANNYNILEFLLVVFVVWPYKVWITLGGG